MFGGRSGIIRVICCLWSGDGFFCHEIPTSGKTGQKWGTRATFFAPLFVENFWLGAGFVSKMRRINRGMPWQGFRKFSSRPYRTVCASESDMGPRERDIFEETYRVVAVENESMTIQGVQSGKLLTIVSPSIPLTEADYPPGRLIALSDPLSSRPN